MAGLNLIQLFYLSNSVVTLRGNLFYKNQYKLMTGDLNELIGREESSSRP
jgi:hypothetical protein